MENGITEFGKNGSGGRHVGVHRDGVSALIQSSGPEQDAECLSIARAVDGAAQTKRAHDDETALLRSLLARARAERDDARVALSAALTGKRRFFTAVLCKPVAAGAWDGPVSLLDPEKQESGFGLFFDSLADVRRQHPELWVVGARDGGILLDAFAAVAS